MPLLLLLLLLPSLRLLMMSAHSPCVRPVVPRGMDLCQSGVMCPCLMPARDSAIRLASDAKLAAQARPTVLRTCPDA